MVFLMRVHRLSSATVTAAATAVLIFGLSPGVFGQAPFAPFSTTGVLSFKVTGTPPTPTYWSAGHGDITAEYHEGNWEFGYHFGEPDKTPATGGGTPAFRAGDQNEYEAGDLTVYVPDNVNSQFSRPAGISWAFTGVASGAAMHRIPSTEFVNLPYVGFAAEDLNPLDGWGPMNFRLDSVSATALDGTTPITASISVWETDFQGNPLVGWSSFDPSTTAGGLNTFEVPAGDHEHFNIGFSAPGIYNVAVTVSAVPEPAAVGVATAGVIGLFGFALRRFRRQA